MREARDFEPPMKKQHTGTSGRIKLNLKKTTTGHWGVGTTFSHVTPIRLVRNNDEDSQDTYRLRRATDAAHADYSDISG